MNLKNKNPAKTAEATPKEEFVVRLAFSIDVIPKLLGYKDEELGEYVREEIVRIVCVKCAGRPLNETEE